PPDRGGGAPAPRGRAAGQPGGERQGRRRRYRAERDVARRPDDDDEGRQRAQKRQRREDCEDTEPRRNALPAAEAEPQGEAVARDDRERGGRDPPVHAEVASQNESREKNSCRALQR